MDWRRARDLALMLSILIGLWIFILLGTAMFATALISLLHHFVKAWNGS